MFPLTILTMRIEKIEKSKHKQERILVYLEGESPLRLTGDALLRFGLQAGMDLPEETVVQLREEEQRYMTRSRGAHIVSSRMVSKKELKDRLQRRGADAETAEETADWLEELGAVNDEAYAGAIARHYGQMGYGRLRVQQELQRRGIGRELWDDAIAQLPEPAETIRLLLDRRTKGGQVTAEEGRKLSAMLQRRGFSWREIRPVLQEYLSGAELPED